MKYSILIPRGESAMIKNITLLDSILDVANCVDINDNNTYIARKVIENCVWLKDYEFRGFLSKQLILMGVSLNDFINCMTATIFQS